MVSDAASDRYAWPSCIVSFRTCAAGIDAMPDIIARLGRALDAELRRGFRRDVGEPAELGPPRRVAGALGPIRCVAICVPTLIFVKFWFGGYHKEKNIVYCFGGILTATSF